MSLYFYFFAYNFFILYGILVVNGSFESTQLGQPNNTTINSTSFVDLVGG